MIFYFNNFFNFHFSTKGKKIGPYELIEPVGSGTFGTVWKAKNIFVPKDLFGDNEDNLFVAIKIIDKESCASIDSRTKIAREVSIMNSFDHPLITELFYYIKDDDNFYIVMEYLPCGSLLNLINKIKTNMVDENMKIVQMDEITIRKIFIQMFVALEYLHNEQRVAHRDIKPENILFDKFGNIRIIDFGLSGVIKEDLNNLSTTNIIGSIAYSAPEVILRNIYTKSADVWSLGVILYLLATLDHPFIKSDDDNIEEIIALITNNEPIHISHSFSLSVCLSDLIKRMLEKDPNKRITLQGITEHPWFHKQQYNELKNFITQQGKITDIDFSIDQEIVNIMKNNGLPCHSLEQDLFLQEIDTESATYKEIRKSKMQKKLSEFYISYYKSLKPAERSNSHGIHLNSFNQSNQNRKSLNSENRNISHVMLPKFLLSSYSNSNVVINRSSPHLLPLKRSHKTLNTAKRFSYEKNILLREKGDGSTIISPITSNNS